MVIFSPSNDTIHAVKAEYDHLATQRTQLYGNLWYKTPPSVTQSSWEEVNLPGYYRNLRAEANQEKSTYGVKRALEGVNRRGRRLKKWLHSSMNSDIGDRDI